MSNADKIRWGRSISACAEASRSHSLQQAHLKVYLRVCGGIGLGSIAEAMQEGLSPRVRRHHAGRRQPAPKRGSISACAEASWSASMKRKAKKVYLRVCGGI